MIRCVLPIPGENPSAADPSLVGLCVCVCVYVIMDVKFPTLGLRNTAKLGEGKICPGLLSLFSWRVPFQGRSRSEITHQLQPVYSTARLPPSWAGEEHTELAIFRSII